jgi:putative aminopeptidase FrvX
MNIKEKFLELTSATYPYGYENELETKLPENYQQDGLGNYYVIIGDRPNTMFTCHLDTASGKKQTVNHVIDEQYIKTDGNSILGADDKAGMVVILNMIENQIPGLYYFFVGEERGCVGSTKLAQNWKKFEFSNYINKCISFDRRGTGSVITEQIYGPCCSQMFANEVSKKLNSVDETFNYQPDPTGIYTDSAQFTGIITECTNISVGYYSEHSSLERQDILHLEKLCKAVCQIDWESIPVSEIILTKQF